MEPKRPKHPMMNPAEQYLQNAFELSVADELGLTDNMLRSLWMTLLQESVKKGREDKVKKWKSRVKRIERKPSSLFTQDLYELCEI